MKKNRLLGESVDLGRFQLIEHLLGETGVRLYIASRAEAPSERYLASVVRNPHSLPVAELRHELGYEVPGVLDLGFIGRLDVQGEDLERNAIQETFWAMLERIPEGTWLPELTTQRLGPLAATQLGISAGEILQRAVERGIFLTAVRPELIWATQREDRLEATGLTGRARRFFSHMGRGTPGIIFDRAYYSPETYRSQNEGEHSVTFTLAMMIAEWCTGEFPFPGSWMVNPSQDLFEGKAKLTDLPPSLERVLRQAFSPDPATRPTLRQFLDELRSLDLEPRAI